VRHTTRCSIEGTGCEYLSLLRQLWSLSGSFISLW